MRVTLKLAATRTDFTMAITGGGNLMDQHAPAFAIATP